MFGYIYLSIFIQNMLISFSFLLNILTLIMQMQFKNVQTKFFFNFKLIFNVCLFLYQLFKFVFYICVEFWTKLLRNALNLINMFYYKILKFLLYAMYIFTYDWFGFCRFFYHCVKKKIAIYCKSFTIAWLIDIIF